MKTLKNKSNESEDKGIVFAFFDASFFDYDNDKQSHKLNEKLRQINK